MTKEEFTTKYREKYPKVNLKALGDYVNSHIPILVLVDGLLYLIAPKHLMTGTKPSLSSAIDKLKWIESKNKYANNYKLIRYLSDINSVEISCEAHGNFIKTVGNYLAKQGCPTCSKEKPEKRKSTAEFVKQANLVHNGKYEYKLTKYVAGNVCVDILCKEHGLFKQLPYNHLQGKGCKKCGNIQSSIYNSNMSTGWNLSKWEDAAKNSKTFTGYKCYVVRLSNNEEIFYKVGRTYREIKDRFSCIPYEYEVISIIEGTAKEIWDMELHYKTILKEYRYKPKLMFNGSQECYSQINLLFPL